MLNAYLKACDDLTDILPEEEQQGLQESVRRLHKQWKVSQSLGHPLSLIFISFDQIFKLLLMLHLSVCPLPHTSAHVRIHAQRNNMLYMKSDVNSAKK